MRIIPKRWRGPFRTDRCSDPPPALLLEGIRQFNRREFFRQHETLEELWRGEPDDVRYLYQGILQVGVGLYHLQRGNYRGAVSKLEGGLEKLRWFAPACRSVDVARLLEDSTRCLERLRVLGPDQAQQFDTALIPMVHLVHRVPSP